MTENIEILKWKQSPDSKNRKGDNKFECKSSSGSRFIRNDIPPQLNYQLFLTEEDYKKIQDEFGKYSWFCYKNSVVHFYGGNYIYCTNKDFFIEVRSILNIETVWI